MYNSTHAIPPLFFRRLPPYVINKASGFFSLAFLLGFCFAMELDPSRAGVLHALAAVGAGRHKVERDQLLCLILVIEGIRLPLYGFKPFPRRCS